MCNIKSEENNNKPKMHYEKRKRKKRMCDYNMLNKEVKF